MIGETWPAPMGHGELILVVDDDEAIRRTIVDILHFDGYTTAEAANGPECLGLVGEIHPALILMDGLMSGMSGWQVYDALMEVPGEHPPIIFVSAVADFGTKIGTLRVGAADFIAKPFALEELLVRVAVVLRRGQNGS